MVEFSRWIQGGFTVEPPRNDLGRIFSGMIQFFFSAQKSELQVKSRSYGPKVRVTDQSQSYSGVPIIGGFPVENPTKKATASKLF